METLWRNVPRLDSPDRLWLLPAPQAKWLGAGLASGPVASQVFAVTTGHGPVLVWGDWQVWVIWAIGLTAGCVGAFYRPGGRHLGQWMGTLLDYHLRPRRATWKPVGSGALWW
jgi:hypothetical protein